MSCRRRRRRGREDKESIIIILLFRVATGGARAGLLILESATPRLLQEVGCGREGMDARESKPRRREGGEECDTVV